MIIIKKSDTFKCASMFEGEKYITIYRAATGEPLMHIRNEPDEPGTPGESETAASDDYYLIPEQQKLKQEENKKQTSLF